MKLATGAMAAAGLALASVGCHKDGASSDPSASRPADDVDAMWKLAPDNLVVGFVASGRAIELASHVVPTLLDAANLPEMADYAPMLKTALAVAGMPSGQFLDLGFAAKPCAVFAMKTGKPIVILPLGDRDKLVKSLKGKRGDVDQIDDLKCKPVSGVYACAEDLAQLDHLGKGPVPGKAAVGGVRGDIEVYAPELPIPGMPSALSVAIGLDPGQVDVRAVLAGTPAGPLNVARMMKPLAVDPKGLAGFATFDIGPALLGVPDMPLVGGVSTSDVAHSLKGPMLVTLPAGVFDIQMRAPLTDPKPISTLLEHCGEIAGAGLPITVTAHDGACRIESPQVPGVGVDIWVDGKELRVASKKGAPPAGKDVPLTAVGKELASGDWTFALWGRGSLLAPSVVPFTLPGGLAIPSEAKIALRAMGMMSEIGMGVKIGDDGVHVRLSFRTAWGNPPDVVKKILDISPDDFLAGKAGDKAKAIAAASPSSPFAGDVASGQSGMALPAAIIGILAAVAVPAFMDYMKKSKQTESSLELNKIAKSAKRYYAENSKFPIGDIAAPPTCCGRKSNPPDEMTENKCPADAAEWQQGPWKELEFAIDEPHVYRYAYHSDGKTITAKAIGDADCDGEDAVYTLEVTIDPNGMPVSAITQPAPGVY